MFRKIVGWLLVIFGVLSALDFVGPLIPGQGFLAVLIGLVSAGSGVWLLGAGSAIGRRLRALASPSRPRKAAVDPMLSVRVLRLARASSGTLTVSEVAMTLEVGLEAAQAALDDLVEKGQATADVDISSGVATYAFPEFLPGAEEAGLDKEEK